MSAVLPAAPLLRQIELRGGPSAVGVRQRSAEERALARARRTGRLTLASADRLAVRLLGLTLDALWDMPAAETSQAVQWRPVVGFTPSLTATRGCRPR